MKRESLPGPGGAAFDEVRRFGRLPLIQKTRPDGGMGAGKGATVALDALVGVPYRNHQPRASFFMRGDANGPGSVLNAGKGAHGQIVALLPVHDVDDFPYKSGPGAVVAARFVRRV